MKLLHATTAAGVEVRIPLSGMPASKCKQALRCAWRAGREATGVSMCVHVCPWVQAEIQSLDQCGLTGLLVPR